MRLAATFASLTVACAAGRPVAAPPAQRGTTEPAATPEAMLRSGLTALLPGTTRARLAAPDGDCTADAALQAAYRDGVDDALGGRRYLLTDAHVATTDGLACARHRTSTAPSNPRLVCCTKAYELAAHAAQEVLAHLGKIDGPQLDAELLARFPTLADPRVDRVLLCAEYFQYGFAYANEIARGLPPVAPTSLADCAPGAPTAPPPDLLGCWSHGFTPEHAINQQGSAAAALARARAACVAKLRPTP